METLTALCVGIFSIMLYIGYKAGGVRDAEYFSDTKHIRKSDFNFGIDPNGNEDIDLDLLTATLSQKRQHDDELDIDFAISNDTEKITWGGKLEMFYYVVWCNKNKHIFYDRLSEQGREKFLNDKEFRTKIVTGIMKKFGE